MPSPPQDAAADVALRWLIRLRWVALAGQGFSLWLAWRWLPVPINLPMVLAGLFVTAITNLGILALRQPLAPVAGEACGLLLSLDTATLTLMLHATGGANHPFAAFYLLHLTLAALLLVPRWIIGQLILCLGGLAWLSFAPENRPGSQQPGIPTELHFHGLLIALTLTGTGIAYFVGRVQADLRRHAAALQESQARWARHERFAGLATLAAGAAHELATPLGTIAVVSQELEKHARLQCVSGACREDARLIRQEVERCRGIIARLNPEAEDTTERLALDGLEALLRPLLSAEQACRLRCFTTTPGVILPTSRTALLQSLAILVKNAAEADSSGGPVELAVQADLHRVRFMVRDHGTGMNPATAARVGEPFFTTKEPGRGMGLGLYIVRMFAERMRGRLIIDSTVGAGSAITLELPLHQPEEPNAA